MEIVYITEGKEVTDTLKRYGCPENELWLIEDSSIEMAENFYGDIIWDLCNGKEYKRCIYYHESGSICAFGGYNNQEEFKTACKFIANYLK